MSSLKSYAIVIALGVLATVGVTVACSGPYVLEPVAPRACPRTCPDQYECTPRSGVCHYIGRD